MRLFKCRECRGRGHTLEFLGGWDLLPRTVTHQPGVVDFSCGFKARTREHHCFACHGTGRVGFRQWWRQRRGVEG
jgi:hypothetical protein